MSSPPLGTLFVVATPIGNLEDITLRALRLLGEVDLIAAEDTRHTRKLLSHFQIHTPLISYYREKEQSRATEIIEALQRGKKVALVSDAGTPGISDPGAILVQQAREAGLPVVPVPGVSALGCALSVSGHQGSHLFLGFLPAKSGDRRRLLKSVKHLQHLLVFYESPRRLLASLSDCLSELGDRQTLIGRELTKIHEELAEGSLSALQQKFADRGQIKGELVVMIAGHDPGQETEAARPEDLDGLLRFYRLRPDCSLKDAVQQIARDLELPRAEVYRKALQIWEEECLTDVFIQLKAGNERKQPKA